MRTERNTIKFRSRKQSAKGICAFIIAIFSVVASVTMIAIVAGMGGAAGILTGVLALLFMAIAAAGFVLALKALYERDVLSVLPVTALLLNGFVVIFYLCMYIIGF